MMTFAVNAFEQTQLQSTSDLNTIIHSQRNIERSIYKLVANNRIYGTGAWNANNKTWISIDNEASSMFDIHFAPVVFSNTSKPHG